MAIPRVQFPASLTATDGDGGNMGNGGDGESDADVTVFDPIANSTDEDLMTVFVAELYIAAKKIAPHKASRPKSAMWKIAASRCSPPTLSK